MCFIIFEWICFDLLGLLKKIDGSKFVSNLEN